MTPISRIQKRDGRVVPFDQNKITEAIWKAAQSVGGTDHEMAEKISNQVSTVLEVFFKEPNSIPTVEQIQDLVEKILIENGHAKTAKAFILHREKHHKLRELFSKINYTQSKRPEGLVQKPIENSSDYSLIQISNDPEITLEGLHKLIMTSKNASSPLAFDFSSIDSAQAQDQKSPIDFFKIFDIFCQAFHLSKEAKKCLTILQINHPSVLELVKLQQSKQKMTNISIVIGITSDFIEAVKQEKDYELKNPLTGKAETTVNARSLIELIMDQNSGLGIMFLNEAEQKETLIKDLDYISRGKNLELPLGQEIKIEEVIPPPIEAMI